MNVSILRWILNEMAEEDLIDLAQVLKTKVPGFRQISVNKKLKVPRSLLVQHMAQGKSLLKLIGHFEKEVEENEDLKSFRGKTLEELIDDKAESSYYIRIFISLITSNNSEDTETVKNLFNVVKDRSFEVKDDVKTSPPIKVEPNDKKDSKDENVDKTNYELLFYDLQVKFKEQEKSIKRLEKQLAKITEKKNQFLNEKNDLTIQLNSVTSNLQQQNQKIEELESLLEATRLESKEDTSTVSAISDLNKETINEKMNIVIFSDTYDISSNSKYHITTINVTAIDEFIQDDTVNNADEIWLLQWEVPLKVERRIYKLVQSNKLRIIQSLTELRNNLK